MMNSMVNASRITITAIETQAIRCVHKLPPDWHHHNCNVIIHGTQMIFQYVIIRK